MNAKKSKKSRRAKIISRKLLLEGRVFNVVRERIVEPSGIEATRDLIEHPGSVVVLPLFPDGRILLIRQYRHAARQYLWELVAGRKDEGENFVQGAHRELQEETGYTAKRMRALTELFPTPGFVTEKMAIFLAEDLKAGKANPEEDEKIALKILTLGEAERWIHTGKIRDAKTVAGILYYARFVTNQR
ncbi:MAG: NUDIX hydrolase [Candidatus Acidiferrales bacterium]